ncbi:glycosyltransferase family 4 protein [Parabacteroides hominis]|uniref:Glycosyltransferase family 4 protein n=1 Tax=Parabacteroides hominis TaxID=2763057 RepID=A0ABR7DLW8_9BACT|nr:glycosyltransferase family 1 protein [Parabacteroides hominis]MBC5632425.1 glycosyltransferase family 4 protein [Parabacteroides hominis]
MKKGCVLYDHQAFEMQRFGGISNYFHELIRSVNVDIRLSLLLSNNYYVGERCRFQVATLPYKWFNGPIKSLNRKFSCREIRAGQYDLFHPTYYNPYFLSEIGHKPFVLTVHDMNHELFPHLFPNADLMIAWKKKTIESASRIIAISENTRRDILRFYDIEPQNITVIYHGVGEFRQNTDNLILPERYLLYVGARSGYKNFERFLLAFKLLAEKDDSLHLICVGKPFKKREWLHCQELKVANRIQVMQTGTDDLGQLYRQALLFVYPSLYEGFGIPILEAYANHCPVALSNASCFPEIAGEAGAYFEPESVDSIYETISSLLDSDGERTALIQAGKERLKRYSWQKTAEQTELVYHQVMEENN